MSTQSRTGKKRSRATRHDHSDSESEVDMKKKAKAGNDSVVQRILKRARQTSTSAHDAESESNKGYRLRSASKAEKSKASSSSKGKGKMRQVPEKYEFGKIFIYTDGCYVKDTKKGQEFMFGTRSSHQLTKKIPDASEFNKAKHTRTAAECDLRQPVWSFSLDMESSAILDTVSAWLPDLIRTVRNGRKVKNTYYDPIVDADFKAHLPPLIPLVRSGTRHLAISAGALQYPDTSYAEDLSRSCPDRTKGKSTSVYHHTLYLLTRTPITAAQIASWAKKWSPPPPEELFGQKRNGDGSTGSGHESDGDCDSDESDEGVDSDSERERATHNSSLISKERSSDGDEMFRSHRIQPTRRIFTRSSTRNVEASTSGSTSQGGVLQVVIDSDEDDEDDNRTAVNSSAPGSPSRRTDNEEEEINVSNMLSSMASVSNIGSPPAMNDGCMMLDLYKDPIPDFKF
ncbi:hypothetical protein VNI00_016153 [Paramarasmius palmivorus]|uniref:Uncharacterized protein n=1 Tax=Paramarasmius palmivorus TaxID=297713 RepID=A0AAW0BDV1_9AGAR